jgi:hypothetical protein
VRRRVKNSRGGNWIDRLPPLELEAGNADPEAAATVTTSEKISPAHFVAVFSAKEYI